MSIFFITFRESLEAGIIVGMLLGILQALYAQRHVIYIWMGVALGVVCSILFAWLFYVLAGGFVGRAEEIYEGVLMLVACGLITHMVFWMREKAKTLRTGLKKQVQEIVSSKTLWMLAFLSFCAVVREGVETVIFLNALDVHDSGAIGYLFAVLGILAAVALCIGIYYGSKKVPVKAFFHVSGVLLLIIAGGLLAHGIVELQSAGLLPIIMKPVYDMSALLNEKEGIGQFLKALFGYDANPSLIALVAYFLFVPFSLWFYHKGQTK